MSPVKLSLGDTRIELQIAGDPAAPICVLHLHANERTALAAAAKIVRRRPLHLISLRHDGGRHLRFVLDGVEWLIDPNRIFSNLGAFATLDHLNPDRPPAERQRAADACSRFAAQLLRLARWPDRPIIAAHNNADDGQLTIHSFRDAQSVHVGTAHPAELMLTTTPALFAHLKAMDHNVVLEAAPGADDGSLSKAALRARVAYINVECRPAPRGQSAHNQLRLLDALYVLERYLAGPAPSPRLGHPDDSPL